MIVAKTEPESCPKCGGKVHQDEDVLDTWFSSASVSYTHLDVYKRQFSGLFRLLTPKSSQIFPPDKRRESRLALYLFQQIGGSSPRHL